MEGKAQIRKTPQGCNRSGAVRRNDDSIAQDGSRAAWLMLAAWAAVCIMEVMGWTL